MSSILQNIYRINTILSEIPLGAPGSGNLRKEELNRLALDVIQQCEEQTFSLHQNNVISKITSEIESLFITLKTDNAFREHLSDFTDASDKMVTTLSKAFTTVYDKVRSSNKIIDYPSLWETLDRSTDQLMVYGFGDCGWVDVIKALVSHEGSPIKGVYTYEFGRDSQTRTFDRRLVHHFRQYDRFRMDHKYALANMLFENLKRRKEGLPIIPILFLIDEEEKIPEEPFYPPHPSEIIGRRDLCTFKELRRAYKLCEDPALPKELRAVAKEMFCFAQLQKGSALRFKKIQAPWEGESKGTWEELWATHKAASVPESKREKRQAKMESGLHWQEQLIRAANPYLMEAILP